MRASSVAFIIFCCLCCSMASIDDILNASDSDDEDVTSHNVDLESLLQSKGDDSDEDETTLLDMHRFSDKNQKSISDVNDSSKNTNITKFDSTVLFPTLNAEQLNSNEVLHRGYEHKKGLFENILEKEENHFNSLEMADQREQRFLKTGSKEVISALQTKRSNNALNSYSNLKLDEMTIISSQLKRNGNYKQHGPGAASCVLVHSKFVAIGTTRGLIILFDHSQEIRQVIGSSVQLPGRSGAPVTSLDVTWTAAGVSLLLCGYATGEVALWDVLKGTVIKRINDLHQSKIIKVSFVRSIGEGLPVAGNSVPAVMPDLVAVTADAKGVMHRTKFVKALWTAFTAESECLLDGTSGAVLDLCPLQPFFLHQQLHLASNDNSLTNEQQSSPQPVKMFGGMLRNQPVAQFLSFNFTTQTCIVQVAPFVKIVHKWPAPSIASTIKQGVGAGDGSAACLDWSWSSSGSTDANRLHDAVPLLVRCWGSSVELLAMDASTEHGDVPSGYRSYGSGAAAGSAKEAAKYSFRVLHRSQFDGHVFVSVKWLSPTRLLLLSLTSILVLSSSLELVEQSPLSPALVVNSAALMSTRSGPEDSVFLNTTCVCGRLLYVLSSDFLFKAQLQSCFDLAHQLIHSGQWLEALALILENVNKSPSLLVTNAVDIDKCIFRYVELAVRQPTTVTSASSASQSRNHYHLVAGVCIEYCVATRRLDLLYGELLDNFTAAHQDHIFLESLEPYILSRAITCLPPNIIAQFFESALSFNRLPSIERCVTYFDIHSVDLNFVTRFLFQHRMFSSFLYAFANGLGDFVGAFQIIFGFMVPVLSGGGGGGGGDSDDEVEGGGGEGESTLELLGGKGAYPNPDQADVGYKLLLFLLYTFEGREFPRGDAHKQPRSVLMGLLSLVTDRQLRPAPSTFSVLPSDNSKTGSDTSQLEKLSVQFGGEFPYLTCLSYVDPEALLRCVSEGLGVVQCSSEGKEEETEAGDAAELLSTVYGNLFAFCVQSQSDDKLTGYRMPSLFLDKCLELLCSCTCALNEDILRATVKHCAAQTDRQAAEVTVTLLAERQSRYSYNGTILKQELCSYNFWSAALSIRHQQAVGQSTVASFEKALQYYLSGARSAAKNGDAPKSLVAPAVFEYILHQFQNILQFPSGDSSEHRNSFCGEVVRVVAELFVVNPARTKDIVCAQLTGHVSEIVAYTKHDARIQFELLHAMVSNFGRQDESASSVTLKDCFSSKNVAIYFRLLSVFDSPRVYGFLQRHWELIVPEECLTVCREHGISDAMAYLLERSGDVSSALSTLQRDLSQKIKLARRDIDAQLRIDLTGKTAATSSRGTKDSDRSLVSQILSKQGAARTEATMRLPMYTTLSAIVDCAADLCASHNNAGDPAMWFSLFDHLLIERQGIRSGTVSSSGEIVIVLIGLLLQTLMVKMKAGGVVAPQDIIRRVTTTSHAAGVRLGEFRDVMTNMLAGNSHELLLSETVNRMIHADLVQLHGEKISRMRRAVFHEEAVSPLEDGAGGGSDDQSVADNSSNVFGKRWSRGRLSGTKRFRKYSETPYQKLNQQSQQQMLASICVPPCIGSFSSDFESRAPGSLALRAVYTAQLDM